MSRVSLVSKQQPNSNKILARKTLHSHSSPIVSKNSHRVWCIIKVQSVIRRWLAVNRYQKMLLEFRKKQKEQKEQKEKERLEKEEQQASAVINYSGVCNSTDNSSGSVSGDSNNTNNNNNNTTNNDTVASDNDSNIGNNDQLNKSIQSSSSSSSSSSYGDNNDEYNSSNNNNNDDDDNSNNINIENSSNLISSIDIATNSLQCSTSPQDSSLSTASSLDDDIGKLTIDDSNNKQEVESLADEEKEKLEDDKSTNSSNSNNNNNNNSNNNNSNNNNNNSSISNNNSNNKKIPLTSRSSSTISMSSSSSSSSLSSSVSDSSASLSSSINTSQEKSSPNYLRKRTLDEMLRVERGYVQDMTTLIDVFLKPFRDEDTCFPKHHLYTLFCNIEDIRDHHQLFLNDIIKKFEPTNGKPADLNIGDLFLPFMGNFQKLYEIYINNYEKAFALTRYFKINPNYSEVQKLIYQKEKDPRCRHLDFNSFLVIPVQRLPRYIVLLKEIEKNTPTDNMDYNFIALSLVQLQDLTLYLNESKRKSSNHEKIEDIKNTVFAANPIIGQSKYVMEGQLSLLKGVVASTKKDLYIYLFKECILCTEVNPNYNVNSNSNNNNNNNNSIVNSNSNSSGNLTLSNNSSNNSPNNLTPKKNTFLTLSTSSKSSSSTSSSPSTSISPNSTLTNSAASSVSGSSTIHNASYQKIIFKTIFFSDVKTISLLKNFKDSFQVVTSKKVYTFVASSLDSRDKWINCMNDCIANITPPPSPTLSRNSNRFSVQLPSSLSPTLKRKNRNSVNLSNTQNS